MKVNGNHEILTKKETGKVFSHQGIWHTVPWNWKPISNPDLAFHFLEGWMIGATKSILCKIWVSSFCQVTDESYIEKKSHPKVYTDKYTVEIWKANLFCIQTMRICLIVGWFAIHLPGTTVIQYSDHHLVNRQVSNPLWIVR